MRPPSASGPTVTRSFRGSVRCTRPPHRRLALAQERLRLQPKQRRAIPVGLALGRGTRTLDQRLAGLGGTLRGEIDGGGHGAIARPLEDGTRALLEAALEQVERADRIAAQGGGPAEIDGVGTGAVHEILLLGDRQAPLQIRHGLVQPTAEQHEISRERVREREAGDVADLRRHP